MSQAKVPATVRILTLNSEKTLRRCLESVKNFAEILVLDGNSTDSTLAIAHEYGARIEKQFPNADELNIPIKDWPQIVNRALALASYDWVFYVDSDEAIAPSLEEEIRQIVSDTSNKFYIYQVPNRIIYLGREILYATPYPGYQKRLVNKKSCAHYDKTPHYQLFFDENKFKVGTLKNPWYVFIDEAAQLKKRFIILEALDAMNQSWSQFFYWSVWRKLSTATKIFIKMAYLRLRYGFKNCLPLRVEFLRVQNKLMLCGYLIRQKVFHEDLEKIMP